MSSFTMHIGKLLIVVIALSALTGCATYYHGPRESEPHATLTFEKPKEWLGNRPTPRKLNGGRPINHLIATRRTFRIGVGTMRLELAEDVEGTLFTSGPSYTCELSFEAEAGRRYLVSMLWEDDGYLYAVTADNGTKVAECKAQEACEWRYGADRVLREFCSTPPTPGEGKGEGAIVIRDDALVYKKVDSSTGVTWKLKRGNAVVANYSRKLEAWQFYEESGRVQIAFLDETAGRQRGGWMRLDDLAKFTYDCNYDPVINPVPGYPFTPGIRKHNWNVCFQEARDAKLKELRVTWAEE